MGVNVAGSINPHCPKPSGRGVWVPAFAGTTLGHFFTKEHAGSGGPNASSPEIFARIL
jgi:hypothetical protein